MVHQLLSKIEKEFQRYVISNHYVGKDTLKFWLVENDLIDSESISLK